ncbi:hypothetical protein FHX44_116353 [Pseudonocardia hierapolitana]|uniref:Uncharacterized protein n=1 Tax=Pseudonocardia hierapolitana TaxID=1128676 RepID=A0A561SZW5_9PSEU|nr:hypothetical protein FHX44_116353 [Pseudonocardia hierapolitana]
MIIRIVVDLPAPLGPRNPVTCPAETVNDRSSTTVRGPYRLVSFLTSMLATAGIVATRSGRFLGASVRTL